MKNQINVTDRYNHKFFMYYILYTMANGLVIYAKSRPFNVKAKAKVANSTPRPDNPKFKATKFGFKAMSKATD